MNPEDPNPKITIDKIHGGKIGDDLKGCYFQKADPPSDTYNFFSKNNRPLLSGITPDSTFEFILHQQTWKLTVGHIHPDDTRGTWKDLTGRDGGENDGTYQAQSGDIAVAEKSASYAKA